MQQTHDRDEQNNPIDPSVLAHIRFIVDRVVGKFGFTATDVADLEQALVTAVLEKQPLFDPARSSWATFARCVVDAALIDQIRFQRAAKRDAARTATSCESLEQEDHEGDLCAAERRRRGESERSDHDRADLRADIATLMSRLHGRTRQVAELLQHQTPSEAARTLNVSRSTIYEEMEAIKVVCRDLDLDLP